MTVAELFLDRQLRGGRLPPCPSGTGNCARVRITRRLRHSIFGALFSRRKARDKAFERYCGFRPSELESRQKCAPVPKERCGIGWRVMSKKMVRSLELGRIAVCRRQESGEHVAATESPFLPDHVAGRKPRLRHLNRPYVAQTFLDTGAKLGDEMSKSRVLIIALPPVRRILHAARPASALAPQRPFDIGLEGYMCVNVAPTDFPRFGVRRTTGGKK